jgi:hypothetical protein
MLQAHMARRLPYFTTQVAIFHFDRGLAGRVSDLPRFNRAGVRLGIDVAADM